MIMTPVYSVYSVAVTGGAEPLFFSLVSYMPLAVMLRHTLWTLVLAERCGIARGSFVVVFLDVISSALNSSSRCGTRERSAEQASKLHSVRPRKTPRRHRSEEPWPRSTKRHPS